MGLLQDIMNNNLDHDMADSLDDENPVSRNVQNLNKVSTS